MANSSRATHATVLPSAAVNVTTTTNQSQTRAAAAAEATTNANVAETAGVVSTSMAHVSTAAAATLPPPQTIQAASPTSCESLHWPPPRFAAAGFTRKCASSTIQGRCSGRIGYQAAATFCASAGARMCTAPELLNDVARGTGCIIDAEYVWTPGVCPTGHVVAYGSSKRKLGSLLADTDCFSDDALVDVRCCASMAPTTTATRRSTVRTTAPVQSRAAVSAAATTHATTRSLAALSTVPGVIRPTLLPRTVLPSSYPPPSSSSSSTSSSSTSSPAPDTASSPSTSGPSDTARPLSGSTSVALPRSSPVDASRLSTPHPALQCQKEDGESLFGTVVFETVSETGVESVAGRELLYSGAAALLGAEASTLLASMATAGGEPTTVCTEVQPKLFQINLYSHTQVPWGQCQRVFSRLEDAFDQKRYMHTQDRAVLLFKFKHIAARGCMFVAGALPLGPTTDSTPRQHTTDATSGKPRPTSGAHDVATSRATGAFSTNVSNDTSNVNDTLAGMSTSTESASSADEEDEALSYRVPLAAGLLGLGVFCTAAAVVVRCRKGTSKAVCSAAGAAHVLIHDASSSVRRVYLVL